LVPEPDHERGVEIAAVDAALDLEEILQHTRGRGVAITRVFPQQSPHDVVERAWRCDARCSDAR
jgi:hypothetical protein